MTDEKRRHVFENDICFLCEHVMLDERFDVGCSKGWPCAEDPETGGPASCPQFSHVSSIYDRAMIANLAAVASSAKSKKL